MREAGFDYTPVDYSSQLDHAADVPYPDSLEFAREYGYGVSTDVWGLDAASARDPNEEYVASMSPEERRAYYTTLLGDDAARGAPGEDEAYASEVEERTARFERQGCMGAAYNQVNAEFLGENGEWSALWAEMNRAAQAITSDPEVVATLADWADCMADAGHPGYRTPEEPRLRVAEQLAALEDLTTYESVDLTDTRQDPDAFDRAVESERTARLRALRAVESERTARLRALRADEIALATAEYTCRDESGYQAGRR